MRSAKRGANVIQAVKVAFAAFLVCYRPQTGSICPSGGVFFPFVSERKGNRKEREFKGCALKNPPHCTELLRSIKNGMFVVAATTGRTSSPFGQKIVRSRKKKQRVCTDITSSAHEPSALDRRSQCNLNRRSSVARGRCHEVTDEVRPCGSMGVCAVTAFSDMTSDALSTALYKISPHQNLSSQLRLLRRRHLIRHGFAATPSPRGEGLVADQNLMST